MIILKRGVTIINILIEAVFDSFQCIVMRVQFILSQYELTKRCFHLRPFLEKALTHIIIITISKKAQAHAKNYG